MAKHSLKEFKDLRVWSFFKSAMHFLCFANHYSSLSNSLTPLQTSQGGGCLHFCFCTSLLALSSSLSSQFSDNETTTWHQYSTENDKLMQVYTTLCHKSPFLSLTNCIPKHDQLSVTNCTSKAGRKSRLHSTNRKHVQ